MTAAAKITQADMERATKAVKALIEAQMDGRPHLSIVDTEAAHDHP